MKKPEGIAVALALFCGTPIHAWAVTPDETTQLEQSCERMQRGAKGADEIKAPIFDTLRNKAHQLEDLDTESLFQFGKWQTCAGFPGAAMQLYEIAGNRGDIRAIKARSAEAYPAFFSWLEKAVDAGDAESEYRYATYLEKLAGGQYNGKPIFYEIAAHYTKTDHREILSDSLKWYRASSLQPGPYQSAAAEAAKRIALAIQLDDAAKATHEADKQAAFQAAENANELKEDGAIALRVALVGVAALGCVVLFRKRREIAALAKERIEQWIVERRTAFALSMRRRALRRKIEPLARERWPEDLFPRIPKRIFKFLGRDARDDLDDGQWEVWQALLTEFPAPPRNDRERQDRELAFWHERMSIVLDKKSEQPVLLPKQSIIDWWWAWERYIWKRYYAATGIHHPTVFSHRWIANEEILYKSRNVKLWGTSNPNERFRFERYHTAVKQRDEFWDREVPAHKERWGEWFFVNIEQAYKSEYGPADDDDVAKQKALGDARLATEDEALAAATGGANRRSAIHDKKF